MYEVFKEEWISGAHRLRDYQGPCENLHGHNWRVRVYAGAVELDKLGMVIDFKVLKGALREVCQRFDHGYLNEIAPFDALNPTAENICRHVFEEVDRRIRDGRVRVTRTMVWENEGHAPCSKASVLFRGGRGPACCSGSLAPFPSPSERTISSLRTAPAASATMERVPAINALITVGYIGW